jgi:hypothetical protein
LTIGGEAGAADSPDYRTRLSGQVALLYLVDCCSMSTSNETRYELRHKQQGDVMVGHMFEGTWEDILQHGPALAGKRIKLIVVDDPPSAAAFVQDTTIRRTPDVALSTDLGDPAAIPYFLWDAPMTVAEFRRQLATAEPPEQNRLLGKLLREARDTDVWKFTTPEEVWRKWPQLERFLGRRRAFWEFLLGRWHKDGLIGK